MIAPATCGLSNTRFNVKNCAFFHQFRSPAMARTQPDMVLGCGDQLKLVELGLIQQVGDFILGEMVVIGKSAGVCEAHMGGFQRGEEFARIADRGEGQAILVTELAGIARFKPGQMNRLCRPRRHPDHRVSAIALTHHQQRIGMANLIDDRCANRTCRKHPTVADPTARVHHQQRLVENQCGALKAIIHDDQIAAFANQQFGALDPIAETAVIAFSAKQHRFIANQTGRIVRQIDKLGMAHSATIAAGEKAGLEASRQSRIAERQCRGGLS
jgi:hypothetical protein